MTTVGGSKPWGGATRLTRVEDVEELVFLFEAVAAEQGWRPGDALRRHQGRSVYFASRVGGRLAGGLQLVPGRPPEPAPHRAVWPEVEAPAGGAHVLILAVLPEYRGGHGLLWPLCVALWRHCAAAGIEELLLEATPGTLAVYRRLGFPLEVVGGLREHWGEDCYLCRMGVEVVADALAARATRSPVYRRIVAEACRGPVVAGERPLAPTAAGCDDGKNKSRP